MLANVTETRQKPQQPLQRAQLLHHAHLAQEIVKVKLPAHQAPHGLHGRLLVNLLGRLLHQPDNITHAQDAIRHTLRHKGPEHIQLLALAGEFDRLTRHRAHGERRTASGIAVQLGEHNTGEPHGLIEGGGHAHRLLTGSGIRHQQSLLRLQEVGQLAQLLDQGGIYLLPTGRVENQHIMLDVRGPAQSLPGHTDHILLPRGGRDHRHLDLPGQGCQLIHGGRPHQVAGHQHGFVTLRLETPRQLGARGCLTGTVQAHHHDAGFCPAQLQRRRITAQQLRQTIPENLDDLLPGFNRFQHSLAHGLLLHPCDEGARHGVLHIGIQQRHADVPQGILDVRLGDLAQPPQLAEGLIQLIGKQRKHSHTIRARELFVKPSACFHALPHARGRVIFPRKG